MIMSRDQNIARNGNIKIGDLSFEEVEKFKYLGATVTNINDTREEIKRRINMGNACYYSVEKLLSSNLLSKNLKVRIYKTVILPVLLYGCETWTLTLREEHRLRVFENKLTLTLCLIFIVNEPSGSYYLRKMDDCKTVTISKEQIRGNSCKEMCSQLALDVRKELFKMYYSLTPCSSSVSPPEQRISLLKRNLHPVRYAEYAVAPEKVRRCNP
ncbi:hypothetical protein ANN_23825 [Periplaneta americana]|uniref:Endonuclease-reverse transcriptase n=1 Tax=Periplaneta americana TaxID=6978 RepID=A0ABQ8SNL7_PERAM|nr:hypothetical protein ANN_23825 [Periplaneta americana]